MIVASISILPGESATAIELSASWSPAPSLPMNFDVGETVKRELAMDRTRAEIKIIIADDRTSGGVDYSDEGKIARFCDTVYLLSDADKVRQAIDVIFQTINKILNRCNFQLCDRILGEIDVQRLSSPLMVGFLSITLASKEFLVARPNFYARVHEKLTSERGLEATNRLLGKYK